MGIGISSFSAKSTSLFSSFKNMDKADGSIDGKAKDASIFGTNTNLYKAYQKALNGENSKDVESFLDQYLDSDAKDDGKMNGSILNNTISNDDSNKKEIVKTSQNFLSDSEIISILDKNDNGKGKVFENTALISELDLLDDGDSNKSIIENFKNLFVKPYETEESNETESTDNHKYSTKFLKDQVFDVSHPVDSANKASNTAIDSNVLKNSSPTGAEIAQVAQDYVSSHGSDGHHCLGGVAQTLLRIKGADGNPIANLTGYESAYQAADVLNSNSNFKEIKGIDSEGLKTLPAGAIVVWSNTNGHEHGHISVALGNGREASDVFRDQITSYSDSYRIFVPNDMVDKFNK